MLNIKIVNLFKIENNMLKVFKWVAIIEGLSLLVLLVGSVLKRTYTTDFGIVKNVGMIHGFLFIAYLVFAFLLQEENSWKKNDMLLICLASCIPFGTFYVDKKYLNDSNKI